MARIGRDVLPTSCRFGQYRARHGPIWAISGQILRESAVGLANASETPHTFPLTVRFKHLLSKAKPARGALSSGGQVAVFFVNSFGPPATRPARIFSKISQPTDLFPTARAAAGIVLRSARPAGRGPLLASHPPFPRIQFVRSVRLWRRANPFQTQYRPKDTLRGSTSKALASFDLLQQSIILDVELA